MNTSWNQDCWRNNLRYADDTTLIAESEEVLKSFLMKAKQESEKAGLKLNIQKTKIMAFGPTTSWEINGGKSRNSGRFYFLGLNIHCKSWIFIGRNDAEAPILWPPDTKTWLIGKDLDAGKDWRQEQKRTTEDEMVGWHHWLDGQEFEQAPGDGGEQGSLVCCSPWARKE